MMSADGKQRNTDVADLEQMLRLIQPIPSKKAEPFKRWQTQGTRGGELQVQTDVRRTCFE